MAKIIAFLNNVKEVCKVLAMTLVGVIAVLCLADIVVPKVSLGVLPAVISTVKSLVGTGSSLGLGGLIVLAIAVVALKK